MILLDTHMWVWWVNGAAQLSEEHIDYIRGHELIGIGVSVISCWEVAKLVQNGRLALNLPVEAWARQAMAYPGITLLDLTPEIAVESCQIPGDFHRDPADQIIVATTRAWDCTLVTVDSKILHYSHVKTYRKISP